jgi:putative ABC transport system permease protein
MSPAALAWRGLVRQPARGLLGIAGVTIVGALLFDMLLLSRGLVLSFGELLESVGFDVRVTATRALPGAGPGLEHASQLAAAIGSLPGVALAVPMRFGRAEVGSGPAARTVSFIAAGGPVRGNWRVVEGEDLPAAATDDPPPLLVNRALARGLDLAVGSTLPLRGRCAAGSIALPPVDFRVVGIAEFRFDPRGWSTAATTLAGLSRACGDAVEDTADLLLVASSAGHAPAATAEAIRAARPDLWVFSNEQFLDRFRRTDFSYFRQISFALSCVTLFFAFLLIATLLTVSVNQRLGEVAALRALGFPRRRVVADLLWESALLVGAGGLLALPLGGLLAWGLDGILRDIPGLPASLHFFVFDPRALVVHGALLCATGLAAAAYPVWLVARLPIAATLRREIVS